MKYVIISLALCLSACTTAPIKRNFPGVPDDMLVTCPALKEVDPTTTKLSTVVGVVSENYGEYQICKDRVDNWVEWYNTQKKIFDSVK